MGVCRGSHVRFVLLAACLAVAALCASRASPAPGASSCASLGAAADFGVFSNGAFNSSGTSIVGRIGAAGNVTLDGISVSPAPGDATPTIVTGGNFTGGGAGGTVNGGVTHGGTANVAANFTINGGLAQAPPPFSFANEFVSLKNESSSLGGLTQSAGASVVLTSYGQLQLTGTDAGLNVFSVDAAQLAQAQGVVIDLVQPGATALINVTTDTQLTIAPQYINLLENAVPADILWNFPLATGLAVSSGVAWQGTILAPNASVTTAGHPQLHGQLIAATVPSSDWVVDRATFTGCLPEPPTPPDDTLTLTTLCIDAAGDLDMRLRNTGDNSRAVVWNDLTGRDFGQFVVPAHSDQFFLVQGGNGASRIRATSGTTTVQANGTDQRCRGQITVQLATQGSAPAGQTWVVRVTDGDNGHVADSLTLGAGDSSTVTVPGGFVPGTAPIDGVVGGVLYTISVDDPKGAAVTTISLNPVEILDGQNELVVVTLVYESEGGAGVGPPVPIDPTLPPEAPDPPPGPGLVPGPSGADLAISQEVRPARVRVGGTVDTVTVVRNLGPQVADGTVAREIPHLRPVMANTVARVLSLTTTAGTCTQRRPVRCSLGTLAPGATVTIRARTRVLVAAPLTSTVTVSSSTPDSNTTNNTASAVFTATTLPTVIHAGISAPPTGHIGTGLSYQVSAKVSARPGGRDGDPSVRLCTRPPSGFVQISAPGTFRFRGVYCRDYLGVAVGGSVNFVVFGFPSRSGRLIASARATAIGVARASRASALIDVGGPAVACPAALSRRMPKARAAC